MRKSGSADLPLHNGHVPKWLADRMTRLGAVLTEAIVHHYGRDEFLRRVGASFLVSIVWRGDGDGLAFLRHHHERARCAQARPGAARRRTRSCTSAAAAASIRADAAASSWLIGDRIGFDGGALAKASRLVAKVDSAAVQDGFDLYLHGFVVSDEGRWVVVQQGMNGERKQARRYHWLSEGMKSFVDAPHAAIEGPEPRRHHQSHRPPRRGFPAQTDRASRRRLGPDGITGEVAALTPACDGIRGERPSQATLPHLALPAHHDVRTSDVHLRRLHGNLAAAAERGPVDFPDLLLTPGVGARTVRALALVAEVVHGAPCRFSDPARFSLAHGGKDRHPFPVPHQGLR